MPFPLVSFSSSVRPVAAAPTHASYSSKSSKERTPIVLSRRNLAAATAALLLVASTPQSALARDAKAAAAAAAERKAALRAAAAASRESGKDNADEAFGESEYSVGEDHTTPNSHSHQSEGARTSGGD